MGWRPSIYGWNEVPPNPPYASSRYSTARIRLFSFSFLVLNIGLPRARFLGPGRIALGAHFRGVDGDRRSARCSLFKANSKVLASAILKPA